MIFNDLFAGSLRLLGVLAAGEVPSGSEATDGLLACNLLLDSWSVERLNIVAAQVATYVLTSGKQTYSIGTTGTTDFNAPRPIKIENAGIVFANSGGQGNLRFDLGLITEAQWSKIVEKSAQATTPTGLYYDRAYPNGNLSLYPTPTFSSNSRSLELYTWVVLTQFPDLVTDVPLAPGYGRAFQTALAVELAPQFNATVSAALQRNADQAKAAIRALNAAMPDAEPGAVPLDQTPAQAPPPAAAPQGQ